MERESVRSSNIASIGYDKQAEILEVQFHNGGIYQYSGVPLSIYQGLMGATSHGTYLNQHVKNVGYRFRKIR
jgi:hypothetical protein